ncbi:hypothetical protein EJ08DRAFT_121098 [Tothia fuscella]|uniref:Uncharacterized protein n=1 Tax=Tothia fuscella TaxID=1048955 RepID=A0A9P4NW70_9PEZI|nr:hypothetical protein EJ08DRAFT_121098 [Tothia fuscella]
MAQYSQAEEVLYNTDYEKEQEGDELLGEGRKSIDGAAIFSMWRGCFTMSLILNIFFLGVIIATYTKPCKDPSLPFYSPAEKLVEYQPRVFSESFEEQRTEYQGVPNDERDKLWLDMYEAFIAIPAEQRRLLANATERMPWEPFRGDLMSALSIGHQMHCLDQLRQSFWPQRYNNSIWNADGSFDYLQFGHFDHCIDMLRQSLMCACDIAPLAFHWNPNTKSGRIRFDTLRTCRNCEKIMKWSTDYKAVYHNHNDRLVVEGDHVPEDTGPGLLAMTPKDGFEEIEHGWASHVKQMYSQLREEE